MKIDITKEEFDAYERVRKGGGYNMMADAARAMKAAELSSDRYWAVLKNYSEAAKIYRCLETKVKK